MKVNLLQLSVYPTVPTMSLLMIKQHAHLRMLQRHTDSDKRLNNIIVKLNKLEILRLSAKILLPLFFLGLLCTLRLSLENNYILTSTMDKDIKKRKIQGVNKVLIKK